MIRCLSNGMEAHYCQVTLRHWLWVNGLIFVWRVSWGGRRLMLPSSTVFSMDEDIIGTISYPPILRLFIFGMIIGIWRGFLFIYLFICDCGAWGSTPNINFSVVAWHASWPRVIFWPAKGSSFQWNLSAFLCFSRQTFLTLAFLLSFVHFSLHLVFLASQLLLPPLRVLLFVFSVSSFFQVHLLFTPFFPFGVLLLSFLCAPISFLELYCSP